MNKHSSVTASRPFFHVLFRFAEALVLGASFYFPDLFRFGNLC